jgi:hypothetical protein
MDPFSSTGSGSPAMSTHADDDARRSTASAAASIVTVARAMDGRR